MSSQDPIVIALPKGRILKEVRPLLTAAGIEPEAAFDDSASRKLKFDTNVDGLKIIRAVLTLPPSSHLVVRNWAYAEMTC